MAWTTDFAIQEDYVQKSGGALGGNIRRLTRIVICGEKDTERSREGATSL